MGRIEKWIYVNCTKVVHAGMGLALAVGNQGVSPLWVDVIRESLEEVTLKLRLRGHTTINLTERGNRGRDTVNTGGHAAVRAYAYGCRVEILRHRECVSVGWTTRRPCMPC